MLYLDLFDERVECNPTLSLLGNTPLPLSQVNCTLKAHAENFIGRLKVISLEFMANALEDISICHCAQLASCHFNELRDMKACHGIYKLNMPRLSVASLALWSTAPSVRQL